MRRFIIALSIIVLLSLLLLGLSTLASPNRIPHEDPATAVNSPDPVLLLLFYGDVFDLASIGKYKDAQSLLADIKYANIADELQYIIDRYNSLSDDLFSDMDAAEALLDEASALLTHYRLYEAEIKLADAETTVNSVQFLMEEIETATDTLGEKLSIFAAPVDSELKHAYDRLQQILDRLDQLIIEINKLWQSLTMKYGIQVQEELIPTELTLSVTPASVFVGDSIVASGILTGDGTPLSNRKLTFFLNNKPIIVSTQPDGSYATTANIPYEYNTKMTLSTVYTPVGDDIGTYLDSRSPTVAINTSYYTTSLEVSAPATGHPGLPIIIEGKVSSPGGAVDRILKVFLNTVELDSKTVQNNYSFQATLPANASLGDQNLKIVISPRERYSGTLNSVDINISKLPIQADTRVPSIIIIPQAIQISGQVYHDLKPITNARVNLTFKEFSTTVKTSDDGSFTATIEAPIDLSLIGTQELFVTIEPVEPYYQTFQLKRRLFTVNPASLGIILMGFISVGLLAYSRGITTMVRRRRDIVTPEAESRQPIAEISSAKPTYVFTGIKGQILLAYLDGLGAVETVTGISMAPHITLREFLQMVTPLLTRAIKSFTELTNITEIALYSARELDEGMVTSVKELVVTLKKELQRDAA
jgi:hypothetical protein